MKNVNKLLLRSVAVIVLLTAVITISYAQDSEDKRGDLVYFISEFVEPSDMAEYELWAQEFKQLADKTNAPDFFVVFDGSSIIYGRVISKDLTSLDALNKEWDKWFEDNEQAKELFEKYGHTVQYTTSSLWRINPTDSYKPEGYDDTINRPYIRVDVAYIINGKVGKAKEIIAEFKAEWTKQKISSRVLAEWNVFGEEQACVRFISWYKDREDWLVGRKEVKDKVSEEKLKELNQKWNALVRKDVAIEIWAKPDWGHSNEEK